MKIGKTTTTRVAPKRKQVKVEPKPIGIPVELPKKKEADVPSK